MKYYSKEETIKRHREMWNWIADQVDTGAIDLSTFSNAIELKEKAIQVLHPEDRNKLLHDCYLCDYAARQLHYYIVTLGSVCDCERYHCYYCPLGYRKTANPGVCLNGIYGSIVDLSYSDNREEFVKVAREIANLPERNFNDSKWKLLSKER